MCGSAINRRCINLGFDFPTWATQFLSVAKALPATVDSSELAPEPVPVVFSLWLWLRLCP